MIQKQIETTERRLSTHEIEDAAQDSRSASNRRHERENLARTARRRKVASTITALAITTGGLLSDGPGRVVTGAQEFPGHVAGLFTGPAPGAEVNEPEYDVSEPDEKGIVTFTSKG